MWAPHQSATHNMARFRLPFLEGHRTLAVAAATFAALIASAVVAIGRRRILDKVEQELLEEVHAALESAPALDARHSPSALAKGVVVRLEDGALATLQAYDGTLWLATLHNNALLRPSARPGATRSVQPAECTFAYSLHPANVNATLFFKEPPQIVESDRLGRQLFTTVVHPHTCMHDRDRIAAKLHAHLHTRALHMHMHAPVLTSAMRDHTRAQGFARGDTMFADFPSVVVCNEVRVEVGLG